LERREADIRGEKRFQPAQVLAASFAAAILIGTLLLFLPQCSLSGRLSLVDAFFTSTSAVCVTGLTVQDTATAFTPLGQVIIMILFQAGGLGIMTFSTLILLVAGKKISIQDKIIIQRGYHYSSMKNVKSLVATIFAYTLVIESAGAIVLYLHWHRMFPGFQGIFHSLFHALSAFCNAGFSLFSDSFVSFRGDAVVNLTLIALIVLGGLGFLVLQESLEWCSALVRRKRRNLSLHAKMVLVVTASLILASLAFFLLKEWGGALKDYPPGEKILSGLFQVITPRTAGFNTMDLNTLSFSTLLLFILLMFIGASPGSTGGGIKTSTFGVIFSFMKSKIAARDVVNVFHRTLPPGQVMTAFLLVTLSIGVLFVSSLALFLTCPGESMREVFFEVFSAFGTVGLSLGITPGLTTAGKVVLALTMFIGRIGPLTLLYAFSRERARGKFEFIEEGVMIG